MEGDVSKETKGKAGKSKKPIDRGLFGCFLDADLLAYKGFCFFLYGAYGGFIPYLPLYFKQLGLGAHFAGMIVGIRPLIQCVGAPFFGVLADRFHAGKAIFLGGTFAWIIKALMILAITPHHQHCIKILENNTANASYVFAYNLWDFSEHEDDQWVVVPFNGPVVIQENRITIVDHTALKQLEVATETPKVNIKPLEHDRNQENAERVTKPGVKPTEVDTDKKLNESATEEPKTRSPEVRRRRLQQSFHARKLLEVDAPEQAFLHFANLGKEITQVVNVFDPKLNKTVQYLTQIDSNEVNSLFIIYLLVIIIGEFLESPAYGLSDASMLKKLGDDRDYYGRIRMWGSFGWCVASLMVGGIIYTTRFYLCSVLQNNYLVVFYLFIAMAAAAFVNALWFQFEYGDKDEESGKLSKVVQSLFTVRHCSFLVGVMYTGMCYGLLVHFVNWYIDDLGGNTLIMGSAGALRECGGIAFFFLSGPVVRSLGSLNTMLIGVLSYVVCFLCYSVLVDPWTALALEALDGASYALVWSNCVRYMGMVGDPLGMIDTTQGRVQNLLARPGEIIEGFPLPLNQKTHRVSSNAIFNWLCCAWSAWNVSYQEFIRFLY